MKLSEHLDLLNIKYIYIDIIVFTYVNTGGETITDKIIKFPDSWQQPEFWNTEYLKFRASSPYYNLQKKHPNFHILEYIENSILIPTGPGVNNLYCLDSDSPKLDEYCLNKNFNLYSYAQTLSCRKKGAHVYSRSASGWIPVSIKLSLDGKNVGDLKGMRKSGLLDCIVEKDVELESFIIHDVENLIKEIILPIETAKKPFKNSKKYGVSNTMQLDLESIQLTPDSIELLCTLIDLLPDELIESYDDWFAWGNMFKGCFGEDGYQFWDLMSQKCIEKYDDNANKFVWSNLIPTNTGIGKLFKAAKDHVDDKTRFTVYSHYHYLEMRHQFLPLPQKEYYNQIINTTFDNVDLGKIKQRCIVLDGPMGSRKTTAIKNYINSNQKVLAITPRISLAEKLSVDFNATMYNKTEEPLIIEEGCLCIQVESLRKLVIPKENDYIVILDEFSSILTQLTNTGTMDTNHRIIITSYFNHLIKNASKIIILEAFMYRNVNKILQLLVPESEIWHIHSKLKYEKRTRIIMTHNVNGLILRSNFLKKDEQFWMVINAMLTKFKKGKKVYVYCSSQKMLVKIHQYFSDNTGYRGVAYHSKMDDHLRQDFTNVNNIWDSYNYVIVTTTVMVGISFDTPNVIDSVFYVGGAFGPLVRDSLQSLSRIRHTITNKIYIFLLKGKRYKNFTTRGEILLQYEKMSELGMSAETASQIDNKDWVKENKINSLLEYANSGAYFGEMLDEYFTIINAEQVEYENLQIHDDNPRIKEIEEEIVKGDLQMARTRVYRGIASEKDKKLCILHVRKNFFDCDFKCKGIELLNIEALKAIRWLKFGCNIDFKNISRYQVGTAEQYYFCFKQIFDKLGIKNIDKLKAEKVDKLKAEKVDTPKAELFDTLIPVKIIKDLDINLLKPLLEKGLEKDNIKMLRKILRLVYLNIERSQSRINGIKITTDYKIIDKKCIWKEIKEF